jgi:hypothetical protein
VYEPRGETKKLRKHDSAVSVESSAASADRLPEAKAKAPPMVVRAPSISDASESSSLETPELSAAKGGQKSRVYVVDK